MGTLKIAQKMEVTLRIGIGEMGIDEMGINPENNIYPEASTTAHGHIRIYKELLLRR
jgi:hypothetical protein